MGGMRCITDQQQVPVPPASGAQSGKPDPAAVVGYQRLTPQRVSEHLGAERDPPIVALARFPRAVSGIGLPAAHPAAFLELHDERAHRVAVGIRVGLHSSDVGLGDKEFECVEDHWRAQPHVACMPCLELRLEHISASVSGQAVDAVGADHQVIRAAQLLEGRGHRAVMDGDSKLLASLTEDREQPLPADGGKPMTARGEDLPVEMHVDVVPDRKILREALVKGGVSMLDAAERLVGKDDPEPESVVCGISLPNLDMVFGVQQLDQRRQIEPRGPATDDRETQSRLRGPQLFSRSRNRCSLPVAVRGKASANSIARGYLYGAIWLLTKSCSVFAGSRPSSAPG